MGERRNAEDEFEQLKRKHNQSTERVRGSSIEKPESKPEPTPVENKLRDPNIYYNDDGSIKYITLSPSVITRFFHFGELREDLCYLKLYHTVVINDTATHESRVMTNGKYFESMTIGMSKGEKVTDLPRKRNGERTADHIRIDEQIKYFDYVKEKHKLNVNPEFVQWHKKVAFNVDPKHDPNNVLKDIGIVVQGTADFRSPILIDKLFFEDAVIDLKLPKDRDGGFGEFNWGQPQFIDPFQLIFYSVLFELPSFYLLFDYKPNDYGYKILPVLTIEYLKALKDKPKDYDELMNKAKYRFNDLIHTITNTALLFVEKEGLGWNPVPSYENCKGCPLSKKFNGPCDLYNDINTI